MKEKNRKKSFENGGFYIALCSCVLIIALVGYMSRLASKDKPEQIAEKSETETYELPQLNELPAEEVEAAEPQSNAAGTVEKKSPAPKPVANSVVVEDVPTFIAPVNGEILSDFTGDELVFNDMLSEWRTHDGIDISADANTDVLASSAGVVEEITSGTLGETIIINHQNGYKTMYANLLEPIDLEVGNEVKSGDVIGKVGNSAIADSSSESHLHFEILYDDKNLDPAEYLE